MKARFTSVFCLALWIVSAAQAQFNPPAGQWLKDDPTHLRVMTWNLGDGLYADQPGKQAGVESKWNATVRIIAGLEPDILILQEAADDNGADPVSQTEIVLDLFRYGGTDPFLGGTVTSYLGAFTTTPGYDLPYQYILGNATDGFNRNIILSRYPIADINGDGLAAADNISVSADLWAPGGNGGVRGFSWAEIDLPDEVYAGDVVIGNSHLKAFSNCSDYTQRINAARNISYFIQYYWNGDQGPTTDPRGSISFPSSGDVLDANTPVIWGGDWNNTPFFNGPGGCTTSLNPVDWMIGSAGGIGDGPDRDGSDAMRDSATVPGNGDSSTQSGSKLDYIAWQDSIATAVEQFIFNTNTPFPYPAAVASGPRPGQMSGRASDHRPVIVDFVLPLQVAAGPPILSSFIANPASASYTQSIDFSLNAFDPDGSIVGDVEFYEDTNNDQVFDAGDAFIGSVTPANPAGASPILFQIAPDAFLTPSEFDALVGSSKTIFARAVDDEAQETVAGVSFNPIYLPPTIDSFSATPNTVNYVTQINVQATASDPDGEIASIEIFLDSNDNLTLDPADDVVASLNPMPQTGMASLNDTFDVGSYLTPAEYAARLGTGNRLFVRVTDADGQTAESALSLTFVNTPPIINSITATPNPVGVDELVTLVADVVDVDGSINIVAFYLDDGDGILQPAQDTLLGISFSPPHQVNWFTAGVTPGPQNILVQASDNQSAETVGLEVVTVTGGCIADFDNDGDVDLTDFGVFGAAFGSVVGDPNYNPDADFDNDGDVDLTDFGVFGSEFGRTDC